MLVGKLPEKLTLFELFPIDISDENAALRLRKSLEAEIAERKRALEPPDAGAPDASAPDASAPDAAAPDAGIPDAGGPESEELAQLELRFAEAQLALLQKPVEERRALVEADAEKKRIAEQRTLAEKSRHSAEQEAQAAEEARKRALEEAERARTALKRALANERALLEATRRDQASLRQRIEDRREQFAKNAGSHRSRTYELVEAARVAKPKSILADLQYDLLAFELTLARVDLDDALSAYEHLPEIPRYSPNLDNIPDDPSITEERAQLLSDAESLAKAADALQTENSDLSWQILGTTIEREKQLNTARINLLTRLSDEKRDAVLGLGRQGIAQLRRELTHLRLSTRYYRLSRTYALRQAGAALREPFALGELVTRIVGLILIFFATAYVRRRGPQGLERIREAAVRAIRHPTRARLVQGLISATDALWPEIVLLVAALALRRILVHPSFPELWVTGAFILIYAVYRLALTAAHRGIAWASSTPRAPIGQAASDKVLRTVQRVGRYALAVFILIAVSETVLGRGYLYHVVTTFAWLGSIPIFALLIRWWRPDITDFYLRVRPEGHLAEVVKTTRNRWYGFFVVMAAFGVITADAASRGVRRFVLGFEQSRKALAYIFRRRLEKRAEESARPAGDEPSIPEELCGYFTEEPLTDGDLAIDNYPGLARFEESVEEWRAGERIGAMLLVGGAGFGKTTWLNHAESRAGSLPITRIRLGTRLLEQGSVTAEIGAHLDAPPEACMNPETLGAFLRTREKRVCIIDNLQMFVLRGQGTWEGWQTLIRIIESTGDRVYWLAAISHYAYEYLAFVRRGADAFRTIIRLPGWSEASIAKLLSRRIEESGKEPIYDDLLVDKVEGLDRQAQLISTGRDYMRLIWDYADGSPRVALHCWQNSLVPDGEDHVRVRLFRAPNPDRLEALSERERFLLGGVIWHENINASEAARALRFPPLVCEDGLKKLTEIGVLFENNGRYRVTTRWQRAVIRYLRRKHLIET